MNFDPSHPEIQEQIQTQLSTMIANHTKNTALAAEQQKKAYIQSQANSAFQAYIQQPSIVGSNELAQLISYHNCLSNHTSTLSGSIQMLTNELSTSPTTPITAFSTLLTTPATPSILRQYFGPTPSKSIS
jgi:hypothetical protein